MFQELMHPGFGSAARDECGLIRNKNMGWLDEPLLLCALSWLGLTQKVVGF
jgi:hypothetical protein